MNRWSSSSISTLINWSGISTDDFGHEHIESLLPQLAGYRAPLARREFFAELVLECSRAVSNSVTSDTHSSSTSGRTLAFTSFTLMVKATLAPALSPNPRQNARRR